MGPLASTERSLMDTGSVFSTGYQSKECTTAGLPTGLNYWRPQSVLLWIPGSAFTGVHRAFSCGFRERSLATTERSLLDTIRNALEIIPWKQC